MADSFPSVLFLLVFGLSFSNLSAGSGISGCSVALCEDIWNRIILHPKNYPSIICISEKVLIS